MTYNSFGAKPGDYVFNDAGLAIGRINTDLTEDNRFTANGKCSIANGLIKLSKWKPPNVKAFHDEVEKKPNLYILKGYTLFSSITEFPVEMWAVKAAEILDGEFMDLANLLKDLSKQPEIERLAKVLSFKRLFGRQMKKKPGGMSKLAKQQVDELFDNTKEYCKHIKDIFARMYTFWSDDEDCFLFPTFSFISSTHWYYVWRQWFAIKTRDTPELMRYFYKRLEETRFNPEIPRYLRDIPYARNLIIRLQRRKSRERHKEWITVDLPQKLEEVRNPDKDDEVIRLIKRTQARRKCNFKAAQKVLTQYIEGLIKGDYPGMDDWKVEWWINLTRFNDKDYGVCSDFEYNLSRRQEGAERLYKEVVEDDFDMSFGDRFEMFYWGVGIKDDSRFDLTDLLPESENP